MQIEIQRFPVFVRIGVLPEEQVAGQDVLISLCASVAVGAEAWSGDLGSTVDYGAVIERIEGKLASRSFALIEEILAQVADMIFKEFHRIESVKLRVEKPVLPGGIDRGAMVAVSEEFTRGTLPC